MKTVNLLQDGYLFGSDEHIQSKYNMVCGSGKGVRFVCSAESISLKLTLKCIADVRQHIGATLTNGIYYRVFDSHTDKLLAQNAFVNNKGICTEHVLYPYADGIYEIFFPITNYIEEALLIVPDNAVICPLTYSNSKIVICGGMRMYGIGCTAANFICSNIIQQSLKTDTVNLSVYDDNFFNQSIAECISEYNPQVILAECSSKGMSLQYLKQNLRSYLLSIININKNVPLFLLGEDDWYMTDEKKARKTFVKETVKYLNEQKLSAFYIDAKDIFEGEPAEMFTYSSNFYNDYANYKIAHYLIPLIRACIL